MRLIDADALKKYVSEWGMNDYEPSDFIDAIDEAPTKPQVTVFAENASKEEIEDFKQELENVLERPTGEWEFMYEFLGIRFYKCTNCGVPIDLDEKQHLEMFHYCQNCGAKMKEAENEDNLHET